MRKSSRSFAGGLRTPILATALAVLGGISIAWSTLGAKELTVQTLANGLTVVLVENHWHPIVALEVCYRVDSRNDPMGKQELAHLLEHVTFQSSGFSHPDKHSDVLGRAGATTNHDTTCYSYRLLNADMEKVLMAEARRMVSLEVSAAALEREKAIVIKERRKLVEGDTWRSLLEEVDALAFRLHPYRFPTTGWPETLARISLDDIQSQFRRYYSPANAVLVAVRDFASQELLARIQTTFGAVAARVIPRPSGFVEPAQSGEHRLLLAPQAAPRIAFAYHVPAFGSPDGATLEVISVLLAGRAEAHLPRLLYRHQLADDVGIEYSPLSNVRDISRFVAEHEAYTQGREPSDHTLTAFSAGTNRGHAVSRKWGES